MAPLINNILHHILARQATEPSSEENDAFADFEFYHYSPSLAAAIIFTLLFIATTALHTYQLIRTRTLYMIPFLIGGFFQSIGYIARAVSATQKNGEWTLGPYIVQSTLILVAPALFAASVYMHLGRVVRMVNGGQTDEKLLFGLIKTTWLTKVFVAGDVISFMMQAGGGGLMATENVDTGETLVLGGLGVQIAFFGLFVFTGVTWNLKMRSRNSVSRVSWKPDAFDLVSFCTNFFLLDRISSRPSMAKAHDFALHCEHPDLRPIDRPHGRIRPRLLWLHPFSRVVPLRLRRPSHVVGYGHLERHSSQCRGCSDPGNGKDGHSCDPDQGRPVSDSSGDWWVRG